MTLDELFEILDCYVEEYYWGISQRPWYWENYKLNINNNTDICEDPSKYKPDQFVTKINYGTNSTFYGDNDLQLKSSH